MPIRRRFFRPWAAAGGTGRTWPRTDWEGGLGRHEHGTRGARPEKKGPLFGRAALVPMKKTPPISGAPKGQRDNSPARPAAA
jgi:hypothetical protein